MISKFTELRENDTYIINNPQQPLMIKKIYVLVYIFYVRKTLKESIYNIRNIFNFIFDE